VRSSEYFRAQARLYRDIAQLMTDRQAADRALGTAAEYLERADDLQRQERSAEYRIEAATPFRNESRQG
jgi:hypothetical protein